MGSKNNAKTEKVTRSSKKARFVVVEIPLLDGCMSMFVGRFVRRTRDEIVLDEPCFVKDTGRRNLFFAGSPDSNAEWEPEGAQVSLPALGAIVREWPHDFTPFRSAR